MTDKQRDDLLISMSQGVMVLQTSINEFRKEFKDADERLYNDLYNKLHNEIIEANESLYNKLHNEIIEANESLYNKLHNEIIAAENRLYNKLSTEVKATSDIFRDYFQYDDKRYDKINEKIIELNKSKK